MQWGSASSIFGGHVQWQYWTDSFLGALFRSLPRNVNTGLLSVFSVESLVVTMLRLSSPLSKDADGAFLASTAVLLIEDWAVVSVVLG